MRSFALFARDLFGRLTVLASFALLLSACSPVSISRIGPQQRPRPNGCEVEVLKKWNKPSRPYKDIGVVALKNCYDYSSPPCLEWLKKAACELGGSVAYLSDERREQSPYDPVVYRVIVAAYLSEAEPNQSVDRALRSRICDPECGDGEVCIDEKCVVSSNEECDRSVSEKSREEPVPERCTE